jgi:hypothetical protein
MHRIDDELRPYIALMLTYHSIFDQLLQDEDVGVAIMGHLVYHRFGVLSRLAAGQGVDVNAR